MTAKYWLFKSDPDDFSFEDLRRARRTTWDGIRNYEARNFLRDQVKGGDGVLFYHSSSRPKAIVGTARVTRDAYPDPAQFDPRSEYHDPAATRDEPRWYVVDIEIGGTFPHPVTLDEMKSMAALKGMVLLKRGRLSVQPVTAREWNAILKRGRGG